MDSSQYAELFLTESREHVSAINHSLLELERGTGGDEPVGAIFRAVHTIKGMAATMGYAIVAELAHELETVLDRVRRGDLAIDAVREITKFDPTARILMCSAMGQQALVVEAIQAGAKDFVVKPFQPSRVLEAVQRVLG